MKKYSLGLFILISSIISSISFAQSNKDQLEDKPPPKPDIIISPKSQNVESYWTEERMRAAKPMPELAISAAELKKFKAEVRKSNALSNKKSENEYTLEPSPADLKETSEYAEGQPEEADINQHPFRTAGKLYFSKPDGNYFCSAQFVGHKRVLMTAAHCLRDQQTGQWYENMAFHQGVRGSSWKKLFEIGCKAVWSHGITGSNRMNWGKDYGFITTYTDSNAGWLGLKSGLPYTRWTAIGYPLNYGLGIYLQKVSGRFGLYSVKEGVIRMDGNPMRNGASGGAWIGGLTPVVGGGNYAVGLNSFFSNVYPESSFGPYFDKQIFELHKAAMNTCDL